MVEEFIIKKENPEQNLPKFKIDHDDVSNLINSIIDKTYIVKSYNYLDEDIRILMPNYLLDIFKRYHSSVINSEPLELLAGIKVIPHYKNEIVIYPIKFFPGKEGIEIEIIKFKYE